MVSGFLDKPDPGSDMEVVVRLKPCPALHYSHE